MANDQMFLGATAKLTIASVDVRAPKDLVVKAQYNPKELQITQPVGWREHESLEGQLTTNIVMEFGGMKASSMQVELLFDGAENQGKIGQREGDPDVTDMIAMLKVLASVRDPYSSESKLRCPWQCLVTWGTGDPRSAEAHRGYMRPFRCVIESLTTKYLMFARDGRVLRASCTVGLKEAEVVEVARPKNRVRGAA